VWPVALLLVVLLGAWELYVDAGGADPIVLPPPHAIASSLWNDRSLLWSNFKPTAEAMLLGVVLAAVIAFVLATAMHLAGWVKRAAYPLVVASQTIPIVMIAPLLVFWLGFGIKPELVVIGLICFFPIVVTTLNGLAAVDPELIKLSRSFDAPRQRIFRHVELPAALPGMLTGAKIAIAIAAIGAVFAEQSNGTTSGLGYLFELSTNQFLIPRAWATVVVLSLFTILLFVLLSLAERLALPWTYRPRGEPTA
jgi:NitT/TauT family transport system permease protein/putative hydroxymethylpyrimidine transport system permease protein